MYIHTYGNPGDPVVLLLHPMLVTGEQMFDSIGSRLDGNYYIIAPDQSSHGSDSSEYVSPEKDGDDLYRYLKDNNYTDIVLMSTLSLGGVLAMQLLKRKDLTFHSVHIDGVPLAPMKGLLKYLTPILYETYRKKANKDESTVAKTLTGMYGEKLGKTMAEQFGHMSSESVKKIVGACISGCAVPIDEDLQSRITFEWGEKESNAKYGKVLAEEMYPKSKIVIRSGYDHCTYMASNTDEYVSEICREIAERQ